MTRQRGINIIKDYIPRVRQLLPDFNLPFRLEPSGWSYFGGKELVDATKAQTPLREQLGGRWKFLDSFQIISNTVDIKNIFSGWSRLRLLDKAGLMGEHREVRDRPIGLGGWKDEIDISVPVQSMKKAQRLAEEWAQKSIMRVRAGKIVDFLDFNKLTGKFEEKK